MTLQLPLTLHLLYWSEKRVRERIWSHGRERKRENVKAESKRKWLCSYPLTLLRLYWLEKGVRGNMESWQREEERECKGWDRPTDPPSLVPIGEKGKREKVGSHDSERMWRMRVRGSDFAITHLPPSLELIGEKR